MHKQGGYICIDITHIFADLAAVLPPLLVGSPQ